MESQNKEVEELPTKSTEKSLEQVLHEEEEYVFDETYMLYNRFNISDVDYVYQKFANDGWMHTDLYGKTVKNRIRYV